jgi:hypothetical protein
VKDIVTNIQAITILSFAAIGLTTIFKELPFHIALPAIMDGVYFVPVLAVTIIFILAYSMTIGGNYAEANI